LDRIPYLSPSRIDTVVRKGKGLERSGGLGDLYTRELNGFGDPMLKWTLAAGERKKVLVEDDESKVSEERWWADAWFEHVQK
jgi:hypothetical protein